MKYSLILLSIFVLGAAISEAGHPYGKKRKPGNKKPKAAYVVNPRPGTPRPQITPRPATPVPQPTPMVKTWIGICP